MVYIQVSYYILAPSPLPSLPSLPLPSPPPPLSFTQFVQCFNNLLDKSPKQLIDLECARLFLTMTASPIFSVKELECALDLFIKYCQVLLQLQPKAMEVLSECNMATT